MFSKLWGYIAAAGVFLASIAGIFLTGRKAGKDAVKSATTQAAIKQSGKVADIRREGAEKEREVKNAEAPADFDRYR